MIGENKRNIEKKGLDDFGGTGWVFTGNTMFQFERDAVLDEYNLVGNTVEEKLEYLEKWISRTPKVIYIDYDKKLDVSAISEKGWFTYETLEELECEEDCEDDELEVEDDP